MRTQRGTRELARRIHRARERFGFTLLELLVTVAVVAILASVALPQYRKTTETAYKREAQDLLLTLYYGERTYFLSNNKYVNPAGVWKTIFMENPNLGTVPVTFTVPVATPILFTGQAQRVGGPCNGKTITINQTGPGSLGGNWLPCW